MESDRKVSRCYWILGTKAIEGNSARKKNRVSGRGRSGPVTSDMGRGNEGPKGLQRSIGRGGG